MKNRFLQVQVKKGSHKAYGYFILVEIELFEKRHTVVRVSNKRHPGLMNKLKVLDGDKKGEHLSLGDDYPVENFLVPATETIQKILDELFKNPFDGPYSSIVTSFEKVPLPKVIVYK